MTFRITEKDKGWNKFLAKLAKEKELTLGVHAKDAGDSHPGGVTVLDVATWMEFGTEDADGNTHVPARSFVREWVDDNRAEIDEAMRQLSLEIIRGKTNTDKALTKFGLWAEGNMKQRISKGIPPELADSTIEKKGSKKTTPLIDTGQLRSSVTHKVTKK